MKLFAFSFVAILLSSCASDGNSAPSSQSSALVGSSSLASSSSSGVLVFPKDVKSTFFSEAVFTSGIEGPAVDQNGNLYVVNMEDNSDTTGLANIGKVLPSGVAEVFVKLPAGSTGNGLRFSKDYTKLFVADYTGHQILIVEMSTKKITTLAMNDNMNQPNDLAIMDNDIILASDPNWSEGSGNIWRILPDGSTLKLDSAIGTTNGIEVSPDNKTLYVGESSQNKIWAYDLATDGKISNRRLLIEFQDFSLDGMRSDANGYLYVARITKGMVDVISPQGKLVQEIQLNGLNPTNVTFGGIDGKTVYVTVKDLLRVEQFQAVAPGRSFVMGKK
jgi:gluconolactonase